MKIKTIGQGKINLVLLHGWGINKNIWFCIEKILLQYFTLHLIDLPGYGENSNIKLNNISHIIDLIHQNTPKKCIWLGWSMGGIIAYHMGLYYPEQTIAVITVASSPCFIQKNNWAGIPKSILNNFLMKLINNYKNTIVQFLTLNVPNIYKQINIVNDINKILLSKPYPNKETLIRDFYMICNTDLRKKILSVNFPILNIYGNLDSIVPKIISKIIHTYQTNNIHYYILYQTAHIPFLSKPKEFSKLIIYFTIKYLNKKYNHI